MTKLSNFKSCNNNQKKENNIDQKTLEDIYSKYKDFSNDDLFSTLMNEVAKQKENGTFDYNALENMVNSLKGAMPDENFEKIKRILNRLK